MNYVITEGNEKWEEAISELRNACEQEGIEFEIDYSEFGRTIRNKNNEQNKIVVLEDCYATTTPFIDVVFWDEDGFFSPSDYETEKDRVYNLINNNKFIVLNSLREKVAEFETLQEAEELIDREDPEGKELICIVI